MDDPIEAAVNKARKHSHHKIGKCSVCTAGHEPANGLHYGKHPCGNSETCICCHNAGMQYGDQCAACGRIEKSR